MKSTSIFKRFLALALAVLLTVSMVPVQAFAEEITPEQVEQTVTTPAAQEEPEEQETPQVPEQETPSPAPDTAQEPSYEQQPEADDSDTEIQTPPVVIYPGLNGMAFGPGELTEDTWNAGTFQPETYDYLLSRMEGVQFVHLLLDYNADLFEAIVTWDDSSEEPAELSWPSGGEFDDYTLLPLLAGSTIFTITVRERQNPDNYVIYTLGMDCGQTVSPFAMTVVEDAKTAKVSFTAQADGDFLTVKKDIAVSADLSETYGYADEVDASESVSTLDVLIRIHELLYGEANVQANLEVADQGWITKIFGKGMNCGFAVNGSQPGQDLVTQAKVKDGDFIEFFYYQDQWWGDLYTWFADPNEDGPETTPLAVISGEAGAAIPVQLRGIPFMSIGYGGAEVPIDSAELFLVDWEKGSMMSEVLGTIVDGEGTLTLPEEPGTYYLTAHATASTGTPIIQTLQKLEVTAAPAPKLTKLQHYNNGYKDIDLANPTMEIPAKETSYMISATWKGDYTVTATYPGNTAGVVLQSGKWVNLTNLPYGEWNLTITVTDSNSDKSTVYTVAVTHPEPERSEDKSLFEGGLHVEHGDHPNIKAVTIYQADAEGKPTESTDVVDAHKTYYAKLPEGVDQFKLTASPNDGAGKVRYSVNGGNWQTWSVWVPTPIDAPTTVQVQILDEKAYAADPDDWSSANNFTIWVDITKVPQSLTVTKAPKKTTYLAGESFDPTGMEVTLTYTNETTEIISNEELTFTPAPFPNETTAVTITYQELTTTQNVTVLRGLEGEGTTASPFLIKATEDAVAFSEMVAAGMQFKGQIVHLVNDITLPEDWIPVGSVSNPGNAINSGSEKTAFYGTFEGNNHTITVPAGEMPFFGTLGGKSGTEALVRNLNIYGTQIESNGLVAWYVVNQSYTLENITIKSGTKTLRSGLMSGYGNTPVTIRNCVVEQGVTIGYDGQQSIIGSIAADFNGTIENCSSAATVQGVNFVGGIVGSKGQTMRPFEVIDCTFSGSVIATGENAGGIVGGGYAGTQWGIASAPNTPMVTIQGCTVTGSVQGNKNVGGILGGEPGMAQCWNNGIGHVEDNVMRGIVSGSENVGAIIGYMHSLNRYTIISSNQYTENCGSDKPIGGVWLVDTNEANPTPVAGVQYICTEDGTSGCPSVKYCSWKADHHRTDDPLGADADTLATVIAAPKLSNLSLPADSLSSAMTPAFDAGTTSYSATLKEHQDTLALTAAYPQGATATASCNGKTVALNNGTITTLTDLPTGTVPVTITLTGENGLTRTYTLTVTNPVPEAPKLSGLSLPESILSGAMTPSFDAGTTSYSATLLEHQDTLALTVSYPQGATATASYGGKTVNLTNGMAANLTGLPTGTVSVSIALTGANGAKRTYTLRVTNPAAPATVTGLSITNYKKEYEVGAPKLDLTGATITAAWSDGSTTPVDPRDVQFEGFSSSTAGTKTITATYEGVSTIMQITVKPAASTATVYFTLKGDSAHGERETPHALAEGNLTTWIARQAYPIPAGGTVKDLLETVCAANNITVHGRGSEYGWYIDNLTRNGVELAEFTNGPKSGWMYTVNGHHPDASVDNWNLAAGQDVIFHYTDDYTWEEGSEEWLTVVSIAISGPSKKTYNKGEDLNLAGLVITATMDNRQKKNVPLNDVTISGYNKNTVGNQTITVTYQGKTATFTVQVKSSSGTSSPKSSGTKSTTPKKRTPEEVVKLIDGIGEVTLEKQDAINEARQAYELLSASEKEKVTNYQTLLEAEAALYALLGAGLSVEDIYRTTGKFLYETVP